MLVGALTQNFWNCKQRTLELSGYGELPSSPRESVPPFAGSPDIPEYIIQPDAKVRFGGRGARNPSKTWRRGSGDHTRCRQHRGTKKARDQNKCSAARRLRNRADIANFSSRNTCAGFSLSSPQFDAGVVRTQQPKVFCDPMMETGNWRKGKMIGSKDDRMNPRIGCGLQQLLAGEIPT